MSDLQPIGEIQNCIPFILISEKRPFFDRERASLERRSVAFAKSERKLAAARHLFEDGDIDREEYLRRKESIERDIAYWQNYTTETDKLNAQLALCVDAVTELSTLWVNSNDEDRRGLAHTLFDEIAYDLDTQNIVSFRLKARADQFLVLRGNLYSQVGNDGYGYAPDRTWGAICTPIHESTIFLLNFHYAPPSLSTVIRPERGAVAPLPISVKAQ